MPGYGKSFQSTNSGSFSPTTDPLPQPGYIWAVDVLNATLTFLGTASSSSHTYIYTMGSALDANGTYDPSTSFANTVTDENGNVVSSDVFQRAFELGYYTSSNFSTVDYAEWINSWAEQSAAFEKLYEMSKTTIETAATVMEVGLTLGAGSFAKWSIKKFFKKKLVKEGGDEFIESAGKLFDDCLASPKIRKQIFKRGWNDGLLRSTKRTPFTTRQAFNKATGNRATAYFNKDGSYIVVDDITNEIIQVSDRLRSWIPDSSIIDPYIPK
jgi:hypothetical protein